jgi:putative ABC transport system permease protein
VQTAQEAARADLAFMSTERPTGIIFGFGVFARIPCGMVIVYQVLSTDVADHRSEYATFKAMGYGQSFFLIVFEEAIVLAIFRFIPVNRVYRALCSIVAATGLPPLKWTLGALLVFFGATLAACTLGRSTAAGQCRPCGFVLMGERGPFKYGLNLTFRR